MKWPTIIQGGMGVGVSNWFLANTVSQLGHLGVVSGTAIDNVIARRLQLGDVGGHIRRALDHFPVADIAQRVYDRYFISGGKSVKDAFRRIPVYTMKPSRSLLELSVVANFTEVFLAKEGHDGVVGINYLEKVQLPNLASIYGAMLAGVDYVLMGAGIPREIPGVLDRFSKNEPASLRITVDNADKGDDHQLHFDPRAILGSIGGTLKRPKFLAIISSATLANMLAKKATGKVDGFIVEGHVAGGHNAPPRQSHEITADGEPIFGERDEPELEKIRKLGLPFWLAGSYDTPEKLQQAKAEGAEGVQVGTLFAFCRESGLDAELKQQAITLLKEDKLSVKTDAKASPTGFPFKVIQMPGTLSDPEVYAERNRICDLGYLRMPFVNDKGEYEYRCPAEPVEDYTKKQGEEPATEKRQCLCNALMSNIGLAQVQKEGKIEKPLLTAGKNLETVKLFLSGHNTEYSAADVIEWFCPVKTASATQ